MKTSQSLLGQAIILEPATSEQNVIQPLVDSCAALTLRQHSPTQSAPLFSQQDSLGRILADSYTLVVTLTSAQIKTLLAAPITLIAAPGPNKLIIIDSIAGTLQYGGVDYANGGNVSVYYSGDPATAIISFSSFLFTASATTVDLEIGGSGTTRYVGANSINNAIVIANVGVAEFDTGNSTFRMVITYRIVSTA